MHIPPSGCFAVKRDKADIILPIAIDVGLTAKIIVNILNRIPVHAYTLGLCYLHHKDHSNKHRGACHHRAQEQGRDIGLPALQEKPYFIGAAVWQAPG